MLFNSYQFLFLFLPVAAIVFYILGHRRIALAKYWLTAASLFFYSWWRPFNILLIAPSIAINYLVARYLISCGETQPGKARLAFWFGIAFNLGFLCYFKYLNFFATVSNDVFGTSLGFAQLVLPLGISFITFQKIALLVDVRAGRVAAVDLKSYALFVLFFPPLISGPIVHYRELMPQFDALDGRWRWENLAIGGSLFFAGLFKKLLIADPIAVLIAPIWLGAAQGGHPALFQAWAAALGYMAQLYFDFSGYSDMAIGAARLFGVRLPFNFNSPLKAVNIIEFWSRWHVTLTRFLTSYIFSPLSLSLTRGRMERGLPVMAGRRTGLATFLALVAFPTMATMLVSGLWHGAGYGFIVFGLLHGVALVINHAWRLWRPKTWPEHAAWARLSGWGTTILFVVAVEVFFRAADVGSALRVLGGMAGAQGVSMPPVLLLKLSPLLAHLGVVVQPSLEGGGQFSQVWLLTTLAWAAALLLPNTLEVFSGFGPALGYKIRPERLASIRRLVFQPTPIWAFGASVVALAGMLSLGRVSAFLYWQF